MEHTPTPWEADTEHCGRYAPIFGAGEEFVASAWFLPSDDGEMVQNTNAEFIVRACNSHDELLEACKWLVSEFTTFWRRQYDSFLPTELNQALESAGTAIAKAEEEK